MGNNLTNKKSLALSTLNCQINDFSVEILDLVSAASKGDLYKKFVEEFLMYIPVDFRSRNKIKLFGDFTHEAYNFFLKKPEGIRKIVQKEHIYALAKRLVESNHDGRH